MVTLDQITAAVESRYDYYSARAVVREALKAASLAEKKDYEPSEVASLADAIPLVGERVDAVVARLRDLAGNGTNGGAVPAPPEASAPSEAAPEEQPSNEPPGEPVAAEQASAEHAEEPPPEEADAVTDESVESGDADSGDEAGGKGRRRKKK